MTPEDREHLVGYIVSHLGGAQKQIQRRQTALFHKADPDYGKGVAEGLGLDMGDIEKLASMSQEERAKATARRAGVKSPILTLPVKHLI